ncbi:MAG TPA: aminoglycoside phosphotransferase family protein [Thermoanaerobaculia bacterium]
MRYFNTVSEARSYLENHPALLARAERAALKVARDYRVPFTDPVILASRSNLLLHLRPAPVVARVALATAILRPDVREFLAREVAVAGFLAMRGARAVPPSQEIPPGPHEMRGQVMSFWRFVEPAPDRQPSVAAAAEALQELHGALRDFPGELPYLPPPLVEIPRLLDRIERRGDVPASDLALLREAWERLAPVLRSPARPVQALHGDAHLRNLIPTAGGLLWNDFEDTCSGPVEWDLACFCWPLSEGREAALAAYGAGAPTLEDLAPWLAARELQGTVWLAAMAPLFPDRRARAEEMLARWRRGGGHLG